MMLCRKGRGSMLTKLVPLLISGVLATGCYGTTAVGYSPGYTYATPDMAYVGPGVSVIANYDLPIFYSGGYYWYNTSGAWYRSPYYTHGWNYVSRPPYAISSIRSPYAYRYYRPYGYAPRYRPVPYTSVRRPAYQSGYYPRGGYYNRGGTYRGGDYYRGGTYRGGSTYRGGTYRGGDYYRGGTTPRGGYYPRSGGSYPRSAPPPRSTTPRSTTPRSTTPRSGTTSRGGYYPRR